jgi:formylglycine-generating enzyme required for sulfatase activity
MHIHRIVQERERKREFSTGDVIYTVDDESLIWTNNTYPAGTDNIPVSIVSLHDASDFATWVSAKYQKGLIRLPTWNEWMIASYGSERAYPWGNHWDPALIVASFEKEFSSRRIRPEPVGSIPGNASPEGIVDLLGNVSEYIGEGDPTAADYFDLGSRWMGGDYSSGRLRLLKDNGFQGIAPRNDYWGYSHHATMKSSGMGIRLVLDPQSALELITMPRLFGQNNKAWSDASPPASNP